MSIENHDNNECNLFEISDFEFLSQLKDYNSDAVHLFEDFINWINKNLGASKDEIQSQLLQLNNKLDILPKGKCKLEVCGLLGSGKTYWGRKIQKILSELGIELPITENDITDKFDGAILKHLGLTRDSEFFKQNLRNIGYITMKLIPGIHAAPFSTGKQLDPDIPSLIVRLSEEERMQQIVQRNSSRDSGRSPYNLQLNGDKIINNRDTHIENGEICYLHNAGDLHEIANALYHFLCKNRERFGISNEKSDDDILNIINEIINKPENKSESEIAQETRIRIAEALKNPQIELFKESVDKRERYIRDKNLLSYISVILKDNLSDVSGSQDFITEYINSLKRENNELYILRNSERLTDLQEFLRNKGIDENKISQISTELENCLSTKKINEDTRLAYVQANVRQYLSGILGSSTKMSNEAIKIIQQTLFEALDPDEESKLEILLQNLSKKGNAA